jgi:tRNA(adenine34) deaminase
MARALRLAERGGRAGEVPVAALLVRDGTLLAAGCNAPLARCDPTAHAELIAVRRAAQALGNYRLLGTTLYVTLEPCVMCVGALVHARIARLVYAAPEPRTGAVESRWRLLEQGLHNHQVRYTPGVLAEPAAALLRAFFRVRRVARRAERS